MSAITSEDLEFCFRLLHELCQLSDDPYAWNTHLLEAVSRRVSEIELSIAAVLRTKTFDPSSITMPLYVSLNQNGVWDRYFDARDVSDQPHTPWIMARLGTDFVATRRDMLGDDEWYGSSFYHRVAEPGGWDDMLVSMVAIDSMQTVHMLSLARATGTRFCARDVKLIGTLHAELARLWRKPAAMEIDALPNRLLQTITGMRRGLSRKELAAEMQVSPHTVHSFEKQLFDRFGVSGRGELLAKVARVIRPTLVK